MLNELQRRVAQLMSGLAEADDFTLAGGGMFLAALGQRRSTRDIDLLARFFANVAHIFISLVSEIATVQVEDGEFRSTPAMGG